MSPLEGKVAVVTGGTGGIGGGIARRLARAGASVVIGGRDSAKAARVLQQVRELDGRGEFVPGDVRSRGDMEHLINSAAELYGSVDIVVPNAGGNDDAARTTEVRGPFADIDLARVADFVQQALLAKLNVVQAAIPSLKSSGGSVVFITSEGGREPTPGQTAISSFSGGLIMASKVLAKELARHHIRVNCVCVTLVRESPSWDAVFSEGSSVSAQHRRQYERIVERSTLGVANPEDIGDVVTFLASASAKHLTGSALSPTGGLTIH